MASRRATAGSQSRRPTPADVLAALEAEAEGSHQLAHESSTIAAGQPAPDDLAAELNRERVARGLPPLQHVAPPVPSAAAVPELQGTAAVEHSSSGTHGPGTSLPPLRRVARCTHPRVFLEEGEQQEAPTLVPQRRLYTTPQTAAEQAPEARSSQGRVAEEGEDTGGSGGGKTTETAAERQPSRKRPREEEGQQEQKKEHKESASSGSSADVTDVPLQPAAGGVANSFTGMAFANPLGGSGSTFSDELRAKAVELLHARIPAKIVHISSLNEVLYLMCRPSVQLFFLI